MGLNLAMGQKRERESEILEDFALRPVPPDKRKPWLDIAMVWIGVAIVLSALLRGMMVGMGLGDLKSVVLAYLLGEGLLIGMMTLTGLMGARTGLTTALLARNAFGERGSLLISFCLGVAFMGWFGVQAGLFAETVVAVARAALPVSWLAFLSGVVMMVPAVFGFRGLKALSYGAVPPMLAIFLYASFKTGWSFLPAGELVRLAKSHVPSPYPVTLGAAASIIAGGFIVGAVTSADIFRYARPRFGDILMAATISMAVSALLQLVGSSLAMTTGLYHENLPRLIISREFVGLGWVGFLAIAFAQWTTNDSNLYSSVLAFNTIIGWTRWKLAIAVGIVSSMLAAWGILARLGLFLSLLSIAVGPIGGIIVADYYLSGSGARATMETPSRRRRYFNPVALAAYGIAVTVGWLTSGHPLTIRVFPFSIFAFNGILAALLLYWAGMRMICRKDKEPDGRIKVP